jgi:transposase InsO family protein
VKEAEVDAGKLAGISRRSPRSSASSPRALRSMARATSGGRCCAKVSASRCTVERLMADRGLHGVIRGKAIRTTVQDKAAPCLRDHVNRVFHAPAPNRLRLSDFTYVSTRSGFVYVAFVIDAYARPIVGWWVSKSADVSFVLDTLEQALHERRPVHRGGLVHHSERGSQYVSIRYTERLAEAGIKPSVGSVRFLGQRSRRDDQRPLQGRIYPLAQTVAEL